jgi:uncharacterized membrane protein (DUF485 family)
MNNQDKITAEEFRKLKRQRNMFFIQAIIGWLIALVVMVGYNSHLQ